MAKKQTTKENALEGLRLLHDGTKVELSNLEQMKDYIEDVLSSIEFVEGLKDKGLQKETLKTFKTVKAQALKVKEALPCLIAFQKAFVKCCGSVIEETSKEQTGRSPSSKASRATTSKTTKKSTTKKQTKGRAK